MEWERNANTSKLRLTYQNRGLSVGSSMFMVRGFYEVAKSREAEYFVNLKEWEDSKGGKLYIAGFTKAKDADLEKEFGEEFDCENEHGQKPGSMSVSQPLSPFVERAKDLCSEAFPASLFPFDGNVPLNFSAQPAWQTDYPKGRIAIRPYGPTRRLDVDDLSVQRTRLLCYTPSSSMETRDALRNHIQSILAVAQTVWKRVLDRNLGLILLVGAVLTLGLALTVDYQQNDVNAGLVIIQIFVSILLIFIGTTEIPRDLASRTVQVFLSKAVGRGEYLLGKFTGLLILGELMLAAYVGCLFLGLSARGLLPFEEVAPNVVRMALQLATLSALLVWLSVMLPEVAATIFGVVGAILSYLVFLLPGMTKVIAAEWMHPFLLCFYYAIPNGQHYVWAPEAGVTLAFLATLAAYSACYCLCALCIASLIFRRRDLI